MTHNTQNIPEEMIINPGEEAFYQRLGARLRAARERLGLSAEAVAAIVGIDAAQLIDYETAVLAIPVYHMLPIAKELGFPPELDLRFQ